MLLDVDDVEKIARITVSRRVSLEIKRISIESIDIREIAGILVFDVSSFNDVITIPKRFMTSEKVEKKYWTIKLEATTGKVISFKM